MGILLLDEIGSREERDTLYYRILVCLFSLGAREGIGNWMVVCGVWCEEGVVGVRGETSSFLERKKDN